jgi:hypothetical protein
MFNLTRVRNLKKNTFFHFFSIFQFFVFSSHRCRTNVAQLSHKASCEHDIVISMMFRLTQPMSSRNENILWGFTQRVFEEFFVDFLFFADFVRRSNSWLNAIVHRIRLNNIDLLIQYTIFFYNIIKGCRLNLHFISYTCS